VPIDRAGFTGRGKPSQRLKITGFVKGHDFSRADKANKINWALAPAKVGAQKNGPRIDFFRRLFSLCRKPARKKRPDNRLLRTQFRLFALHFLIICRPSYPEQPAKLLKMPKYLLKPAPFNPAHLENLACPVCFGPLQLSSQQIHCTQCARTYPLIDNIPVLIPDRAVESHRNC